MAKNRIRRLLQVGAFAAALFFSGKATAQDEYASVNGPANIEYASNSNRENEDSNRTVYMSPKSQQLIQNYNIKKVKKEVEDEKQAVHSASEFHKLAARYSPKNDEKTTGARYESRSFEETSSRHVPKSHIHKKAHKKEITTSSGKISYDEINKIREKYIAEKKQKLKEKEHYAIPAKAAEASKLDAKQNDLENKLNEDRPKSVMAAPIDDKDFEDKINAINSEYDKLESTKAESKQKDNSDNLDKILRQEKKVVNEKLGQVQAPEIKYAKEYEKVPEAVKAIPVTDEELDAKTDSMYAPKALPTEQVNMDNLEKKVNSPSTNSVSKVSAPIINANETYSTEKNIEPEFKEIDEYEMKKLGEATSDAFSSIPRDPANDTPKELRPADTIDYDLTEFKTETTNTIYQIPVITNSVPNNTLPINLDKNKKRGIDDAKKVKDSLDSIMNFFGPVKSKDNIKIYSVPDNHSNTNSPAINLKKNKSSTQNRTLINQDYLMTAIRRGIESAANTDYSQTIQYASLKSDFMVLHKKFKGKDNKKITIKGSRKGLNKHISVSKRPYAIPAIKLTRKELKEIEEGSNFRIGNRNRYEVRVMAPKSQQVGSWNYSAYGARSTMRTRNEFPEKEIRPEQKTKSEERKNKENNEFNLEKYKKSLMASRHETGTENLLEAVTHSNKDTHSTWTYGQYINSKHDLKDYIKFIENLSNEKGRESAQKLSQAYRLNKGKRFNKNSMFTRAYNEVAKKNPQWLLDTQYRFIVDVQEKLFLEELKDRYNIELDYESLPEPIKKAIFAAVTNNGIYGAAEAIARNLKKRNLSKVTNQEFIEALYKGRLKQKRSLRDRYRKEKREVLKELKIGGHEKLPIAVLSLVH